MGDDRWGASWIEPFSMIIWLVLIALLIAGAAWLVRSTGRTGQR